MQSFQELLSVLNQENPTSYDAFIGLASHINISKNDYLQRAGQTCRTIYFVEEGIARIYYDKEGKEVTEYCAFENDLIIRAESLFTGMPSRKAIQAITDTKFLAIPANLLFQLFEEHRDIERLFGRMVQQAWVESIARLESLQFNTAEERYRLLIQNSPKIIREIPLKYVASYLGITQVSLSRIRARFI